MDRSLIAKKVIDEMKRQPGRPFKPRSLFRKCHLQEKDYKILKGILDELYQAGKIQKRGRNQFQYRVVAGSLTGRLQVTTRGFGFVIVEGQEHDVFIREKHMGTAFHGDIVKVEIHRKGRDRNPEGRITEVVQRLRTDFVGVLHADRYGEWVVADDQRIRVRFTIMPGGSVEARPGQVVRISMDHWYEGELEPIGIIEEVLGNPGDPGLDVLKIVREYDLMVDWSDNALKQAQQYSVEDIEREASRRTDLRDLECFTIDPVDAKDFDDAVSLKRNEKGWELGVHIADVSFYVKPNSELDREARERGTTVYLVGDAYHMLPSELSSDLCSLKPDADRLAMSCIMDLNGEGQVTNSRIFPSVIRSRQRFTYQKVQDILEKGSGKHLETLKEMEKVHLLLRQQRKSLGSIDLDIPEPAISLNEEGFPVDISISQRLSSHRMIEEFMLLANRCVAELFKRYDQQNKWPGIYRTHAAPQSDDVFSFRRILRQLGVECPDAKVLRPMDFQKIVESTRESPYRYFIEKLALRSMTKAKYSVKNIGHFGLAFSDYTHFTSPIRRYPDLQVHRLLKLYATAGKVFKPPNPHRLAELTAHCSSREERAMEAERAHLKLKQLQYLSRRIGEEYMGVISGVIGYGLFVELAETLVEGFVHLNSMTDDWYDHMDKDHCIKGRRTQKVYRLGDPVKIRVTSVSVEEGFADFILLAHAGPTETGGSEGRS